MNAAEFRAKYAARKAAARKCYCLNCMNNHARSGPQWAETYSVGGKVRRRMHLTVKT